MGLQEETVSRFIETAFNQGDEASAKQLVISDGMGWKYETLRRSPNEGIGRSGYGSDAVRELIRLVRSNGTRWRVAEVLHEQPAFFHFWMRKEDAGETDNGYYCDVHTERDGRIKWWNMRPYGVYLAEQLLEALKSGEFADETSSERKWWSKLCHEELSYEIENIGGRGSDRVGEVLATIHERLRGNVRRGYVWHTIESAQMEGAEAVVEASLEGNAVAIRDEVARR